MPENLEQLNFLENRRARGTLILLREPVEPSTRPIEGKAGVKATPILTSLKNQ
jgi:hypothetical protein